MISYKTFPKIKTAMLESGINWRTPFMEFVDDFRYFKDHTLIENFLKLDTQCSKFLMIKHEKKFAESACNNFYINNDNINALLASTTEYLCDECDIKIPDWIWDIPSCKEPWFISEYENLKAISIVESPVYFRRRKIFVLRNFLSRV